MLDPQKLNLKRVPSFKKARAVSKPNQIIMTFVEIAAGLALVTAFSAVAGVRSIEKRIRHLEDALSDVLWKKAMKRKIENMTDKEKEEFEHHMKAFPNANKWIQDLWK